MNQTSQTLLATAVASILSGDVAGLVVTGKPGDGKSIAVRQELTEPYRHVICSATDRETIADVLSGKDRFVLLDDAGRDIAPLVVESLAGGRRGIIVVSNEAMTIPAYPLA